MFVLWIAIGPNFWPCEELSTRSWVKVVSESKAFWVSYSSFVITLNYDISYWQDKLPLRNICTMLSESENPFCVGSSSLDQMWSLVCEIHVCLRAEGDFMEMCWRKRTPTMLDGYGPNKLRVEMDSTRQKPMHQTHWTTRPWHLHLSSFFRQAISWTRTWC